MKKTLGGIIIGFMLLISFFPVMAETAPDLRIPSGIPADSGGTVTVPVTYISNGSSISTVIFSVDFDETNLTFDPSDNNFDTIPDSIQFSVSPFVYFIGVTYDPDDTDGELDFNIADISPPLTALPDMADPGFTLLTISFTAGDPAVTTEAPVIFSTDPGPSFGSTLGQSVPGSVLNGSVLISSSSEEPALMGVFRSGWWYLDSNGAPGWNAGDTKIKFGIAGDTPVTGDWNNDGTTDLGIFRSGWWYLDSNGAFGWNAGDTKIKFGIAGDTAVTGDWNGDGYTDMGIYRDGWWYLDSNGTPGWNAGDTKIKFGIAGDAAVTGDWNGDGYTDMGIYRDGWWYLDSNGTPGWNAGDTKIKFGTAGDIPVSGVW